MQVTVEIPNEITERLAKSGVDPARVLLECFALEGYRDGRYSEAEVGSLLGFEGPMQVYELLGRYRVERQYSEDHLAMDIATHNERHAEWQKQQSKAA